LEAITDRRFPPARRLVLDDLAEQLGVSRTPIRVGLTRLAAEGLVEPTGRMGFRVTQLSPEALLNLYDVRLMCELFAVERGIQNVSPDFLRQLEQVLIDPDRSVGGSTQRLAQILRDKAFHELIVGLCGNRALLETYQRLNIHVNGIRVGPMTVSPEDSAAADNVEHGAIIAGLARKDAEAAQAAIRTHVENTAKRAVLSMGLAQ
jgi:DNA-binding GntR family transcriptional regulator